MNRESVKDDITQRTPTILKGPTCSYCLEEGVVDWKWKNCKHYGKGEGKREAEFKEWKNRNIIGEDSVKEYLAKFHSDIVRPLIDQF